MNQSICLLVFLLIVSFALSQKNYEAHFASSVYAIPKGSFIETTMALKLDEPRLYKVTGKLLVPAPLLLGEEVIIDTLKERRVGILLGFPCSYTPTEPELKVQFSIEGSSKIDFPELTIKISASIPAISLRVNSEEISGGSYGLYYFSNIEDIKNVETMTVNIQKTEGRDGTIFNSLIIPPYNKYRTAMQLKSSFSTSLLSQDEVLTDQKGGVTVTSTCFQIEQKSRIISFKINNIPLPIINKKTKQDLLDSLFIHNVLTKGNVQIKMNIVPIPSLFTCLIQNDIKSIDDALNKLLNFNTFVQETNENFQMRQDHFIKEKMNEVIFSKVNRFEKDFKLVCLLEDMNRDSEKVKSVYFVAGNDDEVDKKLLIQPVLPTPSICAIWNFDSTFEKPSDFGDKAATYCFEHFGTKNRDYEYEYASDNGCLQCEVNSYIEGTFDKPRKSICVRSRPGCDSDFRWNINQEFNTVVKDIDSKENIKEKLGIDTSAIESIEIWQDNDVIDKNEIKVTYTQSDGEEFSIDILNNLPRSVSCQIRKEALIYIPSSFPKRFFEGALLLSMKPKENKSISLFYQKEYFGFGYDNKPYNIFFNCFSIANEGHYYETKPFIGLTILRTDKKPTQDDPSPKAKCDETPYSPECLKHFYHKPPSFKNQLFVLESKLDSFEILPYPYKKTMIDTELTAFEKLTMKIDVIKNALYISELLSLLNCKETDNYLQCRFYKIVFMTRLIQKIGEEFKCDNLLKNFLNAAELIVNMIFEFTLILFKLGNNPEAYSKETYQFIFEMTHCMYQNKDSWFLHFKNYSLKEQETKEDYIRLLFSHSANLMDVINYLEADKIIAPNEREIMKDQFIFQYKDDMETLLKDFITMNITSFSYDNFYYVNLNRSDYFGDNCVKTQDLHSIYHEVIGNESYYFKEFKMKLSISPFDIFNQTNADYISFHIWKQYPLLPMNPSNYSTNVVSFKAYKNELNTTSEIMELMETKNVTINSYPFIKYDYSIVKDEFKSGYIFYNETNEFINNFTSYTNSTKSDIKYGEITLEQVGDFTIGKGTTATEESEKSNLLMIILLSVGGGVLVALLAFFIYKNISKKKERSLEIAPLVP